MRLHDGHGRGANGAAGVRVHEIRVYVGEALEVRLVDAGQNQAVRGCQRWRRPREELVEVLAAAATLWETPGGEDEVLRAPGVLLCPPYQPLSPLGSLGVSTEGAHPCPQRGTGAPGYPRPQARGLIPEGG